MNELLAYLAKDASICYGAYGMKEIGDHFGLPYSRVSRILAELRLAKGNTPTPLCF